MILKFSEITNVDEVGNKARCLAELKRENFNVPDGIVLNVNTYKEILKDNKIDDKLKNLLEKMNKKNTSKISKDIIRIFDEVKISKNIELEIMNSIKEDKLYAVRSSGAKEDLDNYSFAGQYESFLNVAKKDICSKIIECYKSMFSEVILNYLLNNNISYQDLEMSVVIQEMVNSEKSGVCFTIDPISGNDKEMLIEVGEGLGENIVSGKVAPEQYYFNWYDKKYRYDENNKLLNKNILDKMTKTFTEIALYFGYPCDIEFAIEKDELFILQARKITKIKYQGIKDIWSTADFKDGGVSATICTPYMWSLYEYIWEFTLKKFIIDSKILTEKEMTNKLGDMFYARCYWNMSTVKKAMSRVVGYKEREFDSEYGIKMNYEGDGEVTKVTPQSIVAIIRMAIAQKKILKTRNDNAETYKKELLEKYEKYQKDYDENCIKDIKETWCNLTKKDYIRSEATYFWQIFINTVHQSLYKDSLLKYVSESDYLTLLGSIEDISHLLPFYDMWEISRDIRNNKNELEFWNKNNVLNILEKINLSKDNRFEKIKKLISDYGYHSDKELDVTYECYYENPIPLINTLKDMIELDDSFSPIEDRKKGKKDYENILGNISKNVSKKKYKKIKTKIEKMRKMLWWREEFRDISTRFYYIIRVYTMEFAKELVKSNVIEFVDDIWFLKVSDLWDYLDKKVTKKDIKNMIEKNKLYYNSYRNFMSENEIGSSLSAVEESKKEKDSVKGLGANSGVVIGTARVIENFEEIDKLQKGDILVTKFTDTGWTPKFAILSGIVTEYGGILCHAAIVSREYGIPAIVSCHDVMKKVKDGQKIKIDGATGVVTIVKG